jgi:hypothetical protein
MKTKYTEDHFVNIVATHDSSQTNVNSTIKSAGKVAEKLNQTNENNDTKKESIKHIKAKFGVSLRETNGKSESCVVRLLELCIDSLLAKNTRSHGCRGES